MLGTLHRNLATALKGTASGSGRPFRFATALAACLFCGLAFALNRPTMNPESYHPAATKPALLELPAGSRALSKMGSRLSVALAQSGFDKCIQDDTDRSMILQFSSNTGAFQFNQCDANPPVTMAGIGSVSTTVSGCLMLNYSGSNGSVSAVFTNGCTSATATVSTTDGFGNPITLNLNDSNIADDTCTTSPVVSILTPNGGEILDAGTVFNITWSARDSVGILSYDILYSTDAGTTFTTITTGISGNANQYGWSVPH